MLKTTLVVVVALLAATVTQHTVEGARSLKNGLLPVEPTPPTTGIPSQATDFATHTSSSSASGSQSATAGGSSFASLDGGVSEESGSAFATAIGAGSQTTTDSSGATQTTALDGTVFGANEGASTDYNSDTGCDAISYGGSNTTSANANAFSGNFVNGLGNANVDQTNFANVFRVPPGGRRM